MYRMDLKPNLIWIAIFLKALFVFRFGCSDKEKTSARRAYFHSAVAVTLWRYWNMPWSIYKLLFVCQNSERKNQSRARRVKCQETLHLKCFTNDLNEARCLSCLTKHDLQRLNEIADMMPTHIMIYPTWLNCEINLASKSCIRISEGFYHINTASVIF